MRMRSALRHFQSGFEIDNRLGTQKKISGALVLFTLNCFVDTPEACSVEIDLEPEIDIRSDGKVQNQLYSGIT